MAELPVEVAEEVKAVSSALAERIIQLATGLNDKAVRAAERRVAEVTRAAGEQMAQAERELADAAQTVDDLEETRDTRQTALDKALRDATDAREAKATLTGELKSLKTHNDQLAALLAGKNDSDCAQKLPHG